MNRRVIVLGGIAATVGFTAIWHCPLGAGEKLAAPRKLTDEESPLRQRRC